MTQKWSVYGCVDVGDGIVERAEDDKAEFFGVYLRNEDGTEDWVADFPRRKEADNFADIHNIVWEVRNSEQV